MQGSAKKTREYARTVIDPKIMSPHTNDKILIPICDHGWMPAFRRGELAVIDTRNRELEDGAPVCVRGENGHFSLTELRLWDEDKWAASCPRRNGSAHSGPCSMVGANTVLDAGGTAHIRRRACQDRGRPGRHRTYAQQGNRQGDWRIRYQAASAQLGRLILFWSRSGDHAISSAATVTLSVRLRTYFRPLIVCFHTMHYTTAYPRPVRYSSAVRLSLITRPRGLATQLS